MKELIKKLTANLSEQDLEEVIMSSDMAAAFSIAKANLNMDQKEFIAYIESALTKAIPMQIKINQYMYTKCTCGHDFSVHHGDGYYSVPYKNRTKYCPECGQALDWGE